MSYRDGKVLLAAHVEPALRDHAREAARAAGLEVSQWVARAVQQAMARESTDRAIATASRQLEGELLTALRSLVTYCGGGVLCFQIVSVGFPADEPEIV